MTPAPTLEDLIESVRADAPSDDPLDQLSEASRTAARMEATGDALLGHFVDQSRLGGYSWSQISVALGVTKQAVHKRFSSSAATFEFGAATFERYTPRAKAVLDGAIEQARRAGHEAVASGDLLLALFEPSASLAAQVLRDAQITRDACAQALNIEATDETEAGSGRLPFAASAKHVLKSAVEEALRLHHNYIGTEHLLLGLYDDPSDPAAQALVALGASYDDIKAGIAKKFSELSSN